MQLHQLEYLVAVADDGSFTRAASRLHVAQPGVSAQIRRLESELGQTLFDRSGRSVRVTDAGAAVLPLARTALAAVAEIRAAADELSGVLRGHVAVGMMTSCPPGAITGALAALHRRHPQVRITLIESPTAELIAGLHSAAVDLAVIGFRSPPQGLHVEVINDDVLGAAVRADHPLARRNSVALRSLAEHELICLPGGSGIRESLDEGCAAAGVAARVTLEASNPEVVADLAASGLGVGVLPESYARTRGDVHVVRVERPTLRGAVGVAWRSEGRLSSAAAALIDVWRTRRAAVTGSARPASAASAAAVVAPRRASRRPT